MKWKNKYRVITFTTAAIICLIVIFLNLLSHKETNYIYVEQTKKNIINLKKDFIKDTVNNITKEIDRLRESKHNSYKKNTEVRLKSIKDEIDLSEEDFVMFFIDKFTKDSNNKMWTAFLWNETTGEVLYDSSVLKMDDIKSKKENLKSTLSSFAEFEKDGIKGIFGVSNFYVEEIVKTEIGDLIRTREFSNDSYIWVNEVFDFEGGKNYAKRRIHPNLIDTEGSYLSTETRDIKGNLPYLEELEGIKKNGALFYTYYFEKLNSSEISEKITYAKLYEDYNWIIAMGVHLDDIDELIEIVNKEINSSLSKIVMKLIIYISIVLLGGFIVLFFLEKKQLFHSTSSLQKKINIDTLTKALSRSCGEVNLISLFKQYIQIGEKTAIMMIDVDDFKYINDKYGHNTGDIALIEIVNTISLLIRSSDQLIRWGGDEFLVILPGLKEENSLEFIEKILKGISSLEIPTENHTIKTSISIGLSYFKDTDMDYMDAIKRADDALYKSKKQGKNKMNVLL